MSNLLITGANRFVGRALISKLALETNHFVRASVRKKIIQFNILGRQDFGDRLLGSLELDITKAKNYWLGLHRRH
jgi:hypothetical protein